MEFLKLEQGNMSVREYAMKFEELIKYSPYFQKNVDEKAKCAKFEGGLRPDLKPAIGHQEIEDFPTLLKACRIYEGDRKAKKEFKRNSQSPLRINSAGSGFKGKAHQGKQHHFKRKSGFYPGGKAQISGDATATPCP